MVLAFDFTPNTLLTSAKAHEDALGPLYDPKYQWPILGNGRIDMRLFSRADMVPPPEAADEGASGDGGAEDDAPDVDLSQRDIMRPAARKLSNKLKISATSEVFAFIAVSGAGKSSCVFDLAREHWVIYMYAGAGAEADEAPSFGRRRTTEEDPLFRALDSDVVKLIGTSADRSEEARKRAWDAAVHRAAVDMVARLLVLVRMSKHVAEVEKRKLTSWEFLVHQVGGGQAFAIQASYELLTLDLPSLQIVAQACRHALADLIPPTEHLVFVVDEMQAAARMHVGEFHEAHKGLLSPLACAASDVLKSAAVWSILFVGEVTSTKNLASLANDVGRPHLEFLNVFQQADFPVVEHDDVVGVLRRLNLDATGLGGLFSGPTLEARALAVPARSDTDAPDVVWRARNFIEDYVVGSRFRVLAGVIERLAEVSRRDKTVLLLAAMKRTVDEHKEGLEKLIRSRVGPEKMRGFESSVTVDELEAAFAGALLTNGHAHLKLRIGTVGDLVELGIACESAWEAEDVLLATETPMTERRLRKAQAIRERFVVDVLRKLFETREWSGAATAQRCTRLVRLLRDLLGRLGPSAAAKGNVVERLVLERVAAAGADGVKVGDLPFIKPFLTEAQAKVWGSVEFGKRRLDAARTGGSDTVDVLSSPAALGLVWSPEAAMRPDGVAMLGKATADGDEAPPRALVFASAVYTDKVTKDKMVDQLRSADLSRSFLSKENKVYPATKKRRQKWCALGLHKSVCVRVIVALPLGDGCGVVGSKLLTPGGSKAGEPEETDAVVVLNKTNIHLVLGGRDVPGNADLYELLAWATKTRVDEWGGG